MIHEKDMYFFDVAIEMPSRKRSTSLTWHKDMELESIQRFQWWMSNWDCKDVRTISPKLFVWCGLPLMAKSIVLIHGVIALC